MRIRFLPVFILIAAFGTGVKLAGLWQSFAGPTPALAAGDQPMGRTVDLSTLPPLTGAGEFELGAPLETAAGAPAPGGAAAGAAPANGAAPAAGTAPAAGAADAAAADSPTPPGQITNLPTDVFKMTDEEITLLQSLSQRREELDQRAREIDQREVLLKAAEQRIDQRIKELEKLQASIEALLVKHDDQTEQQMQSLVKIYSNMKPKDAARIFEGLDMQVLLEVVGRMKERKTAPILAQMNPKRAEQVTLELAQRRELPIPRK